MTIWSIIAIVVAFLGGGSAVWAFHKLRRNKAAEGGEEAIKDSKDSDSKRDEVLHDIDETIKKNKEIRDKIENMLRSK